MNIEQFKNFTVGSTIGFGFHDGYGYGGECGELASYWFSEQTNNKYQFAYGKPNINAEWAIGSDCYTAWNVATQSNWSAMGFEKIDNPSFSQLRAGDIFFISPRGGLSTGHVGIIYSVANNNVVTLEQNFGGARFTQYMPNENSWSYYGGFSCIVRPIAKGKPEPTKPEIKKEDIDMYLIKITDKDKDHKGKCFITNGVECRHVATTRVLGFYENKLKLPVDTMYYSEVQREFGDKNIKYNK